jgi:anti-sigma regulatory factor (Ser/Thr protein kinase)
MRDLALRLTAEAAQIPVARRAMAGFCAECGMPPQLVDDVKLVVTEACTNVILHAYAAEGPKPGEQTFEITAHLDRGALVVTVTDDGCGMSAPSANGGLGLGLRLALQLAGGVQTRDATAGHGTRLSMRFDLPD